MVHYPLKHWKQVGDGTLPVVALEELRVGRDVQRRLDGALIQVYFHHVWAAARVVVDRSANELLGAPERNLTQQPMIKKIQFKKNWSDKV